MNLTYPLSHQFFTLIEFSLFTTYNYLARHNHIFFDHQFPLFPTKFLFSGHCDERETVVNDINKCKHDRGQRIENIKIHRRCEFAQQEIRDDDVARYCRPGVTHTMRLFSAHIFRPEERAVAHEE